jgi:hypothetical protein
MEPTTSTTTASTWRRVVVIAGPAVLLAGAGLTHPQHLTVGDASWWAMLHALLLVLFPLLGLAHWLLLRGIGGALAWTARLAAFMFAAFYTALDVLAGIGTGTLVENGTDPDATEVHLLFQAGNDLGFVGGLSFVVACTASSVVLIRQAGRRATPGGLLLVAASIPYFLGSHIYWPVGVVTMLLLALGFGLLTVAAPS